jgi:hypothetical protein
VFYISYIMREFELEAFCGFCAPVLSYIEIT